MGTQTLHSCTFRPPREFVCLVLFRLLIWSGVSITKVAADEEGPVCTSKIVQLTDTTFRVYDEGFLLVMYHADWSGQSRRMIPLWSKLAEELDGAEPSVAVGLIDSSEHRQNPGSNYVHKLPTIFLFHKGSIVARFVKEKSLEDLKTAVRRITALSTAELESSKILILQQLEGAQTERAHNLEDEEMEEALVSLKFESDVLTLHKEDFYSKTSERHALIMIYTAWCDHCQAMKRDWLELARDPQIPGLLVAKINVDHFKTFPGIRLLQGVPSVFFFRNSIVHGKYEGSRELPDLRLWAERMVNLSEVDARIALEQIHAQEAQMERISHKKLAEEGIHIGVNEEFNRIQDLTTENFEKETKATSALVLFYTERGERSQLMKPVWVALSKFQDLSGLLVAKFLATDYSWSPELEFVHGYPTILLVRNGLMIERYEGIHKLDELYHYAKTLLGLGDEEARIKHGFLARAMQRERLMKSERERLRVKAEQKRREEELRKARQDRRKQKFRSSA